MIITLLIILTSLTNSIIIPSNGNDNLIYENSEKIININNDENTMENTWNNNESYNKKKDSNKTYTKENTNNWNNTNNENSKSDFEEFVYNWSVDLSENLDSEEEYEDIIFQDDFWDDYREELDEYLKDEILE